MTEKRTDAIVMGVTIGTYTGWDGDPGDWIVFYEFEPAKGFEELGNGDLDVSFEDGMFQRYDDAGDVIWSVPAIPVLMKGFI